MAKTPTAKKSESLEIPMNLARLLASEPEDIQVGQSFEDVQKLAKALLRVLMETAK